MKRRNIYTLLSAAILLVSILSGCGGKNPPLLISVSVSPSTVSLIAGATQQFTATVTGTSSTAVTWSTSGCTGSACGTIDANGLYTTPTPIPSAATMTVVATLQSDTSKTGTAKVSQVPVGVTVSPGTVSLDAGGTQQFTAAVTGTNSTAVTWSITGCTGSACGAVDANGLYTAPSSVPSPTDVTVTATAQADPSKFAPATVHLRSIIVSISPSGSVNIMIKATQNFSATVQHDPSNVGVIWSLAASCTPDTCGELSNNTNASVTYTAPKAVPNPATVTLTATSVADNTQAATVLVNVSASLLLPGDYAFVFSGWDGALTRQVTLGHFHADANGNVTSGVEDVNDETGVYLSVPITGSCTFNSNHRGTLDLVSSRDNASYSATLDPTGTEGNFIRLFVSGHPISGSGYFELQNGSPYSSAALAGSYAMELNAKPQNAQTMAAVGRFDVDASGDLSNGEMDMLAPTASYKQMTLGGSVNAPASDTGRGTATFTLTPAPGAFSGTVQFIYYVISTDKVVLMQTDVRGTTAPLLSGVARRQSGPLSLATFNAPAIFELAGMHATYQSAYVGQLTPNGTGSMTGIFDQNYESNALLDQSFSGTYTLDSKGRATLTMLGGTATAYFYGENQAFVMQQPVIGGDILYGNVKPQTAGPYSPASLGTLRISEAEPVSPFAESDSGIITFDGVSSNSFEQDYTFFQADGTYVQQSQTGSANYTLDTNGRGVISVNGYVLPFWLVSADEVTVIDTATNAVDSLPVVQHYLK
jgi:hypothetical protein